MEIARRKTVALEQRQRLSRSVLWKVLRNFYVGRGIEAWNAADGVPHHVTSNPFIAKAY